MTFEFFSIGYVCGFIGLFFFFFPSLLFCLGCFFVGVTHPDLVPFSKHPPFLEMISPGPSGPAWQAPAWPAAMRATGTHDRPLLSTPSPLQAPSWSPVAAETPATGREQGPAWGKACHPEPPPFGSPRGAPPSGGPGRPLSFFLFCPLACPQPEARIIGTGEGAGREDGQTECA